MFQFLNEIGIDQKAHINDEIGVERHTMFKTEGNNLNPHGANFFTFTGNLWNFEFEFMNIVIGRIDDFIRNRAQIFQLFSFVPDTL